MIEGMPTAHRRPAQPRPTAREMEILLAYLEEGSYQAAACRLEVTDAYVGQVLANVRAKSGAMNTAQAVYRLGLSRARSVHGGRLENKA